MNPRPLDWFSNAVPTEPTVPNAQVTTLPTMIVESGSKKLEFIQNLNEFERIRAILENFRLGLAWCVKIGVIHPQK